MSVTETGEGPVCDPRDQFASDAGVCSRPTKKRQTSRWLLFALVVATFFSMGRLVALFRRSKRF